MCLELIGTYCSGGLHQSPLEVGLTNGEEEKEGVAGIYYIYRIYETGSERNHDFLYIVVSEKKGHHIL